MSTMEIAESALLHCLSLSLRPSDNVHSLPSLTEQEWAQVLALADRHEVLPLLETVLGDVELPPALRSAMEWKTAGTVHQSLQLQALTEKLTRLLREADITAITLKGCAVARFYPVPEFRKTSDIDLFVSHEEDRERAVQILCANGFHLSEKWHANHHVILTSEKKEVVEVHAAWTECFQEKHLNQYVENLQKESNQHCGLVDCQGVQVYAYDTAWQGFYLLMHMLLHFVGSGFGLRNLCDWVVLWNNCDEAEARGDFWKMAVESGTEEFAAALTAICVKYLGLDRAKSPVPDEKHVDPETVEMLLRDILDAGEFGYSEAARMVGMDGDSWTAYVREFQHQMHINFPKAGRWIIFWPVLWAATLVRFLRNNRKLHRAPLTEIMKKAGKRGQLVSRLISPAAPADTHLQ